MMENVAVNMTATENVMKITSKILVGVSALLLTSCSTVTEDTTDTPPAEVMGTLEQMSGDSEGMVVEELPVIVGTAVVSGVGVAVFSKPVDNAYTVGRLEQGEYAVVGSDGDFYQVVVPVRMGEDGYKLGWIPSTEVQLPMDK